MKNKTPLAAFTCLILGLNILKIDSLWAKPIIYDFTVNVVQGSLEGNTYQGFFMYDDEKLTINEGQEIINAENGLKVCMNFFNQVHDETKDVDYPQYPALILKEGQPQVLDFWMESPERSIWWNRNGWNVEISQREDNSRSIECSSLKVAQ